MSIPVSECPNQTSLDNQYLFINGSKELVGDDIRTITVLGSNLWGNRIRDDDDYYRNFYTKVCISANKDRRTRGIQISIKKKSYWLNELNGTISSEIIDGSTIKKYPWFKESHTHDSEATSQRMRWLLSVDNNRYWFGDDSYGE